MAETLTANKIDIVKKIAGTGIEKLTSIPGIGEVPGTTLLESAGQVLAAITQDILGVSSLCQ